MLDTFEAFGESKKVNENEGEEVVEFENVDDAGEKLKQLVPGVAVLDLDFTLKPKGYELGLGGREPGRLPEKSMELLKNLKDAGWEVLVVSNQPRKGHQVAKFVREIKQEDYPIFPGSVAEVLGEEGVDGGGWNFLWKKYKSTPEAVDKTATWIQEKTGKVLGQIYFIGDRENDINFAKRVGEVLVARGENRAVNKWKVKGLELRGIFKHLERFIP